MDAQQYRVEPTAKVSADILNMAFGVDGNNEFVASTSLRPIATEVARAMKAHGLAGKITPRLVRVLLGKAGVPIQGRYRAGEIDIRQDAADPRGVLFHEIIHALRDGTIWGDRAVLHSHQSAMAHLLCLARRVARTRRC